MGVPGRVPRPVRVYDSGILESEELGENGKDRGRAFLRCLPHVKGIQPFKYLSADQWFRSSLSGPGFYGYGERREGNVSGAGYQEWFHCRLCGNGEGSGGRLPRTENGQRGAAGFPVRAGSDRGHFLQGPDQTPSVCGSVASGTVRGAAGRPGLCLRRRI